MMKKKSGLDGRQGATEMRSQRAEARAEIMAEAMVEARAEKRAEATMARAKEGLDAGGQVPFRGCYKVFSESYEMFCSML
jgi:hypothetical protein